MYFILLGGEEPERVATGVVSWDYFETLGVTPALGRTFRAADDAHDARRRSSSATVLAARVQRQIPDVLGRVVEMNDRRHTIVGVLPDLPMYPQANDVYMPRSACPFRMNPGELERRGGGMASASGAATPTSRSSRSRKISRTCGMRLQAAYPDDYRADRGLRARGAPLRREFTRQFESTLLILGATAGFVLLIVCASVANLAVARTMRRERELALRAALGASRRRLMRQLITESMILSLAGGACGLLLAFVGMDLLVAYAERFTPSRVRGPHRRDGASLHARRLAPDRPRRCGSAGRFTTLRTAASGGFRRPTEPPLTATTCAASSSSRKSPRPSCC